MRQLLLLILCLPGIVFSQPGDSIKPNIILISLDDMNDYLGHLEGHPQAETPNIDELARQGTTFTSAYSNAVVCSPSRFSFLTGKTCDYIRVFNNNTPSKVFRDNFQEERGNETVFTIPEILKDSGGYFTYNLHKTFHGWSELGFDNDYDTTTTTDPCLKTKSWNKFYDRLYTYEQSIPRNVDGTDRAKFGKMPNSEESSINDYIIVDSAINFLEDYNANPADFCDRPFFLSLGLYRPHTPLYAPEKYFSEFYQEDIYQEPYVKTYNDPYNAYPPNGFILAPRLDSLYSDFENLPEIAKKLALGGDFYASFERWREDLSYLPVIDPDLDSLQRNYIIDETRRALFLGAYLATVKFVDFQVGRFLAELDKYPTLKNNTIIILISDHGVAMGEKKHYMKHVMWEEAIRIPYIIVDPRKNSNQVCTQNVSLLSLFPTILDFANINYPTFPDGSPYLDGLSVMPLLDNPSLSYAKPVLSEFEESSCSPIYSVRSDRFHLIQYRIGLEDDSAYCEADSIFLEEELYDIGVNRETDPQEWYNLAKDTFYTEVKEYLAQWMPDGPYFNKKASYVKISEQVPQCSYSINDTVHLIATIFNANGIVADSITDTYEIVWTNNLSLDTLSGDSISFALQLIDSASFAGNNTIIFKYVVRDTLNDLLIGTDLIQLNLSTGIPVISFDANTDSTNTVRITNYISQGVINRSEWNYGDGFLSQEFLPPPYSYSTPGEYTITNTVYYGNTEDEACQQSVSDTITIDSINFKDSVCFRPINLQLIEAGIDYAKVSWTSVYGASKYNLRLKKLTGSNYSWNTKSTSNTTVKIPNLNQGQAYRFEVQSKCFEDSTLTPLSDWSPSLDFVTKACDFPRFFYTDNITEDQATLKWSNVKEADLGYSLFWGIPENVNALYSIFADSFQLESLEANSTYYARLRSNCMQPDSSGYASEYTELINFNTLDTGMLRNQFKPDDIRIQAWPNPAYDRINIQLNSSQSGKFKLSLTDVLGRIFWTDEIYLQDNYSHLITDISQFPGGLYIISCEHKDQLVTKPIVIQ